MAEEVGALKVGLSIDSAKFEQSMASVDRNLKALGGEMAIVRAKGKEWGDSTEGLTTKQKTLSTMLESQDVKVRKLNEAHQKAVLEQGANSKAAENLAIKINKATAEYTKTETELGQVTSQLKKQENELDKNKSSWDKVSLSVNSAGDKLTAFGDKAKTVGTGLSTGITAPILAVGAAGIVAFNEMDEALDTIITKTGATGKAAEGLSKSFETVAKRVPNDLLSVGEAIGEVNNQFDLTGKALEDASQLMLQFADINKTDVTSSSIAAKKAIEAYGLANSDLTGVLDAVTKTAQETGQSVDFLFDKAVAGAPQIKALGLTFAEGTALIGSFEKSGVDSAGALSSLSKASIVYAKDGKTMEEGLKNTIKSILGAKNETEALTIAAEVFGTKGAVRMVDAIKRGTFNLDEFSTAGSKAAGTVKKTFNETIDPIDEAKIALNNAKIAMGEVGNAVQVAMLPFLKQATEVLGNLTEKFQDLDPETKESIIKFGLLAASIGPAVLVGGHMATSLGAIIKLGSPLISIIGKAGLAGSFLSLANPVGLAVVGVGALGVGLYALSEASKGNIQETLNSIEARKKEIETTDTLIGRFGELQEKNKLSTDEVLRYMDIMSELKDAKTEETIKTLSTEQETLQKKSGMTNDEITEFLKLNGKIVEDAPKTAQAISGQGNAYVEILDKVKELNQAERERLMQDTYSEITAEMNKQKENLQEQIGLKEAIKSKEKEHENHLAKSVEIGNQIQAQDLIIAGIREEMVGSSREEEILLAEKLLKESEIKTTLEEQRGLHDFKLEQIDDEIGKKEKSLKETEKELKLFESLSGEYEALILAQVGITTEKGNGLTKTNEEIAKLQIQRAEAEKLHQAGQINTAEYQSQIGKIDSQIGKLQTAKGEFEAINKVAQQTLHKDLFINEHPKDFWDTLDEKLRRPITKTVSIRYNEMNGPQDPGQFAVGTRYAPGGLALVGEEGPELMYVPQGSKVMPNGDSERLLNKWNIPTQGASSGGSTSNSKSYQTSITNQFYGNNFSPSEIARKQTQAERQMFLAWGSS